MLSKIGGAAIILFVLAAAMPTYTDMITLCPTTPLALQSISFLPPPTLNKK